MTRSRCPGIGLGILDLTSERSRKVKSRKRKPTSGHQERPAKVVDAIKDIEQNKTCKIHWFSLHFEHTGTFEVLFTKAKRTGPQPQALSQNSPKKINVLLICFYSGFVNYEQRHRRRTAHFARATTPHTYYMFCNFR